MAEVAIVASAFGADAIRRDGHAAWIEPARRAGAAAFEVRRELMNDAAVTIDALAALGGAIVDAGLWPVWSTPDALYRDDGTLDEAALREALDCGRALRARFVKLQLGGFARDAHAARVDGVLAAAGGGIRLVVENGRAGRGARAVRRAVSRARGNPTASSCRCPIRPRTPAVRHDVRHRKLAMAG